MVYDWVEGIVIAGVGAVVGALATLIVSALRDRPRLRITSLTVDSHLNVNLRLTNKGPVGTTLNAAWIKIPGSDDLLGLNPREKKMVAGGHENLSYSGLFNH